MVDASRRRACADPALGVKQAVNAESAKDMHDMRPSRRAADEMRAVTLEPGVAPPCRRLLPGQFGDTHVLVTASLEKKRRRFLQAAGQGLGDGRIRHAAALHP